MPELETLIEARGLSKLFAGAPAVDAVDFHIRRGEIVTIIGPNGSGKTTLLRLLLGLTTPDSGSVRRSDGLVIGYVPQKFTMDAVFPLTVKAFLRLFAGEKRDFIQFCEELRLTHLFERPMTGLSGGELQRILLARAMLRNPDLLVLDEPVQGVDIAGQTELYQLVAGLSKQAHCAVLMVSHDLHWVMAATDRVVCLNRHVCCSGHPHSVSLDPAFRHLFGEAAARAIAVYEHSHDHEHNLHGDVVPCEHTHSHKTGGKHG